MNNTTLLDRLIEKFDPDTVARLLEMPTLEERIRRLAESLGLPWESLSGFQPFEILDFIVTEVSYGPGTYKSRHLQYLVCVDPDYFTAITGGELDQAETIAFIRELDIEEWACKTVHYCLDLLDLMIS